MISSPKSASDPRGPKSLDHSIIGWSFITILSHLLPSLRNTPNRCPYSTDLFDDIRYVEMNPRLRGAKNRPLQLTAVVFGIWCSWLSRTVFSTPSTICCRKWTNMAEEVREEESLRVKIGNAWASQAVDRCGLYHRGCIRFPDLMCDTFPWWKRTLQVRGRNGGGCSCTHATWGHRLVTHNMF